ncbi:hypothetical protein AJ80_00464 [Polytolypa hystricis UAMH7299]|uniref:DH domain-containing protein n=1 Tax=Polytolypa hystricis (strain UAMH7299) TaxID=1447883 RepID=A0A2B7YV14_POLH7|nr:hypothetical protein AJ80_00464 [Polytolypa hystricis UAMH7299]
MPASQVDHNYDSLNQAQYPIHQPEAPLSQPASENPLDNAHNPASSTPLSANLPLLPATTYAPPRAPSSPHRLSLTTNFSDLSIQQLQHLQCHHLNDATSASSTDPIDFYLQYHDPFGGDGASPLDGDMTTTSYARRSNTSSGAYNISPASHHTQSSSRSRPYRATSGTHPNGFNFNTSRPSSVNRPPVVKHRQSSLKELVDKFNQTRDEVPPRPSASGSLSSSRAASPAPLGATRTRPSAPAFSRSASTRSQERPRQRSPQSSKTRPSVRHSQTSVGSNETSFLSRGDSNSSRQNQTVPRRPLFGELVVSTSVGGYQPHGIASPRHRRGSEGSMHTPNPMFRDISFDIESGLSPSSPTAWYLGYTPSLDAVNIGARTLSHRRSRSDLAGHPFRKLPVEPFNSNMSISTHPSSGAATSSSKPSYQSRIPVSTRRLSHTSDSGSSAPSTRANSSLGRHALHVPLPSKGASAIPKLSPKPSPTSSKKNVTGLTITSPGRRDLRHSSNLPPEKSPSLKAYISAPPPKKSPPLRSSRPRQPVSSASTNASRARVVDRVSDLQTQSSSVRESRPSRQKSKRLPELGNVDFAARRRQIQQAFNKTVEENAKRKEERAVQRRQRSAEKDGTKEKETPIEDDSPMADDAHIAEPAEPAERTTPAKEESAILPEAPETPQEQDDEKFVTPDEGRSPEMRNQASVESVDDTVEQSQEPIVQPSVEISEPRTESPTIPRPETPELPPASAVTVATDITTFDPEPQTDSPQLSRPHRTVLSQIMQMRESSPSVTDSSDDEHDEFFSDDKESIQIMLGQTRYYDDSMENSSENPELCDRTDDFRSDADGKRWSMSSWNSSIQDRQSLDGPLERIVESSPPVESGARRLSISTIDSSRTPQPWVRPLFSEQTSAPSKESTTEQSAAQQPGPRFNTNIMEQYPHLAKQGGWDSKRVTQLYLQELAKGGFNKTHLLGPASRSPKLEETSRPESRTSTIDQRDGLTEDAVMVPESNLVPKSEYVHHRASLNLRDDWMHTSPSVSDWMQLAAADDSGNERRAQNATYQEPSREGAVTPRNISTKDENIEGLGLSIHVQSPQDDDSPTIPPPLPNYAPPPPPLPAAGEQLDIALPPVQFSPSIYSDNPPSSTILSGPFEPAQNGPSVRDIDEASLRRTRLTPSPQTHSSSVTSQERSSISQSSIEAPIQKSSPTPEQRRLKKRRHVIKELVDTEYTFGRDMTVVVDIYKGTSSSCLDLSPEDVKTLFGNADQVVKFSMDFQDTLKHAAKSVYVLPRSQRWQSRRGNRSSQASSAMSDSQTSLAAPEVSEEEKDCKTSIGEAFMANISQMEKVYSEYLKNHDAANKTLEALMQKKNVSIWLKECRDWASDLTTAWNLDSLLVKPVQRIVKYPLLLTELLSATPPDHPDHAALANALRETTSISVRINDMKKRADVVGQVVSSRKRKESDVRTGLSKAFGRRTEKLKQHVGLSEMFTDTEYDGLSQQFSDNFFQLQLIMRDVELYSTEVQNSMKKFNDFIVAIEAYVTVALSNYPELESKWCRFRLAVKDVLTVALVDHLESVRKSVILPMVTLLKLHDGPQRVMQKRNKRLMDFVRFKAIKDRGEKPDKKTTEQGEQFTALNITLKEELPKLFTLTGKLMEACLNNFVQLQLTWQTTIQKRLGYTIERLPEDLNQIITDWSGDFSFSEAQVLSLGICNGSMLADAANIPGIGSPAANGGDTSSSRRPSTVNSTTARTVSFEAISSPKVSQDFGPMSPANLVTSPQGEPFTQHTNGSHVFSGNRMRANSGFSRVSAQSELPNGGIQSSMASVMSSSTRPSTSTAATTVRSSDSPSLPQLALGTPTFQEFLSDPVMALSSHSRDGPPDPADHPASPTAARYSGFFSSAMPMSESSDPVSTEDQQQQPQPQQQPQQPQQHHHQPPHKKDPSVLFLAASMFEFNIDRSRREAGYPYLTYVAGEIFDVIAEKGDLWLARNQDDATNQVGWIWTKHFAKLAA